MAPSAQLRVLASALCWLAAGAAHAETGDAQVAFNNSCRTCHSIRPDDHRLGPSLHGVIGREAGKAEGYAFSTAMRSSGIVWDEQTLDKFIANPEAVVRGNNMKPYGGIDNPEQRSKIVAYLKELSAK